MYARLDETCCPTDFVECPLCGSVNKIHGRGKHEPSHFNTCPRRKFEMEYPKKVTN